MQNRNEQLVFTSDDLGACRHCERIIGKKDKRNLRVGSQNENDEFSTAVILVSPAAFRCPFCFTRHKFAPFQTNFLKVA